MGAGASISEQTGYIFRVNSCGCIYGCYFDHQIAQCIELKKCCYVDLQHLRNDNFDQNALRKLEKHTLGISVDQLTDDTSGVDAYIHVGGDSQTGWMKQADAIEYARAKRIRGIDEFLYNTNVLARFGIMPTK